MYKNLELQKYYKQKFLLTLILSLVILLATKIIVAAVIIEYPQNLPILKEFTRIIKTNKTHTEVNSKLFYSTSHSPHAYQWKALPLIAPQPQTNLNSPSKILLGKKLFNDKTLSVDYSISCATCHILTNNLQGSDGKKVAKGVDNRLGNRNTPTILNSAFQRVQFWDGREATLEQQALKPILNPIEMGMPNIDTVLERLKTSSKYLNFFADAFPENPVINSVNLAKALAAYQRTLITPNTPYDQFIKGDKNALTHQQLRGMLTFERIGCISCHSGPNFSQASVFSNLSPFRSFPVYLGSEFEKKHLLLDDLGKNNSKIIKRGVWRVPSLRNVSKTAPYFHNGSVESLHEAVRIMTVTQLGKTIVEDIRTEPVTKLWSPSSNRFLTKGSQLLSEKDVEDIVSFLESLTDLETDT